MNLNTKHEWELHCHSRFSDGKLSCPELYSLAVQRGVSQLALTDHDTALGYRESIAQNWVPAELSLHPGAELSCVWRGRTIHVVGVGMDVYADDWLSVEQEYVERREKRYQRILHLLSKAGFEFDEPRLRQLSEPGVPARPHIAEYMVETGQIATTGHAYKRWLGQGKPGDVKQQWPELHEAIAAITRNSGMAILAHPHRYKLTWTKTREILDDFTEAGGLGVEVSCVGMHPEFRKFLIGQAETRHMWVSGGSDFHSPSTSWLHLGLFPQWPSELPLVKDWLENRTLASCGLTR